MSSNVAAKGNGLMGQGLGLNRFITFLMRSILPGRVTAQSVLCDVLA